MSEADQKATLLEYLRTTRKTVLWKLEGLSDYDVRRLGRSDDGDRRSA